MDNGGVARPKVRIVPDGDFRLEDRVNRCRGQQRN
jgi:hypothetical protein